MDEPGFYRGRGKGGPLDGQKLETLYDSGIVLVSPGEGADRRCWVYDRKSVPALQEWTWAFVCREPEGRPWDVEKHENKVFETGLDYEVRAQEVGE